MPSSDDIKRQLSRREISDESLSRLADHVASLDALGFQPKDVFPLGIIIQDGAGVSFEVPAADLGKLVDQIAKLDDLRPEIRIFPKGIISPDSFEVRTTFGRSSR